MERDKTLLKKGLSGWGLTLTDRQMEQFELYYDRLTEKNKVMNLTAITEYDEVISKHFLDSLSLVLVKEFKGKGSLIDVGTGAGFPGIPLKIVFPELEVVLLDSLNKRVSFLKETAEELGLKGIECIHGRAEDMGRDLKMREKFDLCVSRAVANLAVLSEYAMPFVRPGGYFIPYKSGKTEEEKREAQAAIRILSGRMEDEISFLIPGTDIERTLFLIRKTAPIHHKYPRKAGLPKKEPLR